MAVSDPVLSIPVTVRCSLATIAVAVSEVTVDGGSSNEPGFAGTVKQKRSVSATAYLNSAQGLNEDMGW